MAELVTQAAWLLVSAFALSLAYELYRATAKRGTSPHDSMRAFAKNNIVFYGIAAIVIALLFTDLVWAPWVGLAFCAVSITASITFYGPKILIERAPGAIDWFEDILFTALLFTAAVFLVYDAAGVTLTP